MWTELLLLLFVICETLAYNGRIVNGTDAEDGEFPYAVSLRVGYAHDCGATILNEKFVLTAAHCVCNGNTPFDPKMYDIQYGLTTLTQDAVNSVPVSQITCGNNSITSNGLIVSDLAVLELANPIPNDGSWEPVKLTKEFNTSKPLKGVIIGWGLLYEGGPYSNSLQKLEVDVYDDSTCGQRFDLEQHVCLGTNKGGSACTGDSGGALIVDGEQAGITSFANWYCGIANETYPDIYTRVSTYYEWITNITKIQN